MFPVSLHAVTSRADRLAVLPFPCHAARCPWLAFVRARSTCWTPPYPVDAHFYARQHFASNGKHAMM